jgi:uncharacterized membrane protein YcaP (DUF421 family)
MKKEDIRISDIGRILLGEAPGIFLLEVLLRSVVTYIVLLAVVKLLGKRMSGRLTSTEMAVMLMFGAIVSSAMQIPDRGVLEGIYVLFLVLLFQRLLTLWTVRNRKMEDFTLGTMRLLIKDGVLQVKELEKEFISKNQLFRMLRSKNILHLGQVKRLYMESSGDFTVYKYKESQPGLSTLPEEDREVVKVQQSKDELQACTTCGTVYSRKTPRDHCVICLSNDWKTPVINNEES